MVNAAKIRESKAAALWIRCERQGYPHKIFLCALQSFSYTHGLPVDPGSAVVVSEGKAEKV